MNPPDKTKQREPGPAKKRYSSPVIRCYGTIHAITQSAGMSGAKDGPPSNTKTGP